MAGLWVKLVVCPAIVWFASYLFDGVDYPAFYQPVLTGLVLAVISHLMEVLLLQPWTFWTSTLIDVAASFAIVYGMSFLLPGARVTLLGAVLTAALLGMAEYLQHAWLIRTGRTGKA